jgi:hypothetical protein
MVHGCRRQRPTWEDPTFTSKANQSSGWIYELCRRCCRIPFLNVGILDFQPAECLHDVLAVTAKLKHRLERGQAIYALLGRQWTSWATGSCRMHAAGVYAAGVHAAGYQIGAEEALERIKAHADVQNPATTVHSPETDAQKEQVREFLQAVFKEIQFIEYIQDNMEDITSVYRK